MNSCHDGAYSSDGQKQKLERNKYREDKTGLFHLQEVNHCHPRKRQTKEGGGGEEEKERK